MFVAHAVGLLDGPFGVMSAIQRRPIVVSIGAPGILRIFPSSHTNPIFVEVDGKPIRASKKSAEWCAEAVEVCWQSKRDRIRSAERDDARAAYDVAAQAYREIADEAAAD